MMTDLILLAQNGAESDANQWLDKNPLVLGLIFLAIGGLLVFFGLKELKSGVARDKYGNEITGGMGKAISLIRLVLGVGLCGFAIYKMVAGLAG